MNKQIADLYRMAGQPSRRIVGLMSGTSLDGLDIALCRISGSGRQTSLSLEHFETVPYADSFRRQVREVFAKRTVDQQSMSQLNASIGTLHGSLVRQTLEKWGVDPSQVDAIASHGQTVYHAPRSFTGDVNQPNSTLQLGDGDHVARQAGIITVADFRQKHIAAGGEGAPLAAYGDYLLFARAGEDRILLNIGGIANFTYLPGSGTGAFATDIGPGNTLMNQVMQDQHGREMDEDGAVASRGRADATLLEALLDHPFFELPFPKTTGPELFNRAYLDDAQRRTGVDAIGGADLMATLNAFTAEGIARAVRQLGVQNPHIYVSGGGLHNPILMQGVRERCGDTLVSPFEALGVPADAKEAVLFAILANETLAGDPSNTAGLFHSPSVCMGKISFPA